MVSVSLKLRPSVCVRVCVCVWKIVREFVAYF